MIMRTIEEAQKTLDERNGKLELLSYRGMRNKCNVRCRKCGSIFSAIPDSLLRNKSDLRFGCVACAENAANEKLSHNSLDFVRKLNSGRIVVRCKRCGTEFDGWRTNLTNQKFSCQFCDKSAKHEKRLSHIELYGDRTIDREKFREGILSLIGSDSLAWYYCLGLLLSDGSFDIDKNRIRLRLQSGDVETVAAVASILGCKYQVNQNECLIDFCTDAIEDIIRKYNISNIKTYKPCDITSINKEHMIAFAIGFIDGDGSIGNRTDCGNPRIVIKLHESWKSNLQYMTEQVYGYFHINRCPNAILVKQNDKQYATVTWGNKAVIDGLSSFVKENNIPAMSRKWVKLLKMESDNI